MKELQREHNYAIESIKLHAENQVSEIMARLTPTTPAKSPLGLEWSLSPTRNEAVNRIHHEMAELQQHMASVSPVRADRLGLVAASAGANENYYQQHFNALQIFVILPSIVVLLFRGVGY